MNGDSRVLLIVLSYNIIIFVIAVVVFFYLRRIRGDALDRGIPLYPLLAGSISVPTSLSNFFTANNTPEDPLNEAVNDTTPLKYDGSANCNYRSQGAASGPIERSRSFTALHSESHKRISSDAKMVVGLAALRQDEPNDWISVTETSVPLVLAAQELLPEGSVASEKPYSSSRRSSQSRHYSSRSLCYNDALQGRSSHYTTSPDRQRSRGIFSWDALPSWIRGYSSVKDERFTSRYVQLYLSTLRTARRIAVTLSIISIGFVLPVNLLSTFSKDRGDWLDRASAGNVDPYHWGVWVLWLCAWIYSGIAYYYIYKFWLTLRSASAFATLKDHHRRWKFRVEEYTVMVQGISKTLIFPEILFSHFERIFPNCVIHVSLPLDLSDIFRVYRNLKLERHKLLEVPSAISAVGCSTSLERTQQQHDKQLHYPFFLPHQGDKYTALSCDDASSVGSRNMYLPPSVGIAFVSFRKRYCVARCLRDPRVAGDNYNWKFSLAPPPEDIVWEHIHVTERQSCVRSILLSIVLLFILILLTSSAVLTNALLPLMENLEQAVTGGIFKLSVTGWGAPVILLLINSVCLPQLVHWKSRLSYFWRKSKLDLSILHGNVAFLILNSVIFPALGNASVGAFLSRLYHTELQRWNVTLGRMVIGQSGSFALRYLLNASFLSSSVQLLQVTPQWLCRRFRLFSGSTQDETTVHRRQFDFGYWYAFNLAIFFMMLTFGLVVPLLLPLAALFFVFKYHVDKYNFLYGVWSVKREGGTNVVTIVIRYMLFAVAFFQFVMSGFFIAVASTVESSDALSDAETPASRSPSPTLPYFFLPFPLSASKALVLAGTLLFLASLASVILLTGGFLTTLLSDNPAPMTCSTMPDFSEEDEHEEEVSGDLERESDMLNSLQETALAQTYEQPFQAEVRRVALLRSRYALAVS